MITVKGGGGSAGVDITNATEKEINAVTGTIKSKNFVQFIPTTPTEPTYKGTFDISTLASSWDGYYDWVDAVEVAPDRIIVFNALSGKIYATSVDVSGSTPIASTSILVANANIGMYPDYYLGKHFSCCKIAENTAAIFAGSNSSVLYCAVVKSTKANAVDILHFGSNIGTFSNSGKGVAAFCVIDNEVILCHGVNGSNYGIEKVVFDTTYTPTVGTAVIWCGGITQYETYTEAFVDNDGRAFCFCTPPDSSQVYYYVAQLGVNSEPITLINASSILRNSYLAYSSSYRYTYIGRISRHNNCEPCLLWSNGMYSWLMPFTYKTIGMLPNTGTTGSSSSSTNQSGVRFSSEAANNHYMTPFGATTIFASGGQYGNSSGNLYFKYGGNYSADGATGMTGLGIVGSVFVHARPIVTSSGKYLSFFGISTKIQVVIIEQDTAYKAIAAKSRIDGVTKKDISTSVADKVLIL